MISNRAEWFGHIFAMRGSILKTPVTSKKFSFYISIKIIYY